MNAREMQTIAKIMAEEVYNRLVNDEKFIRKVKAATSKGRMLNTKQACELLGIKRDKLLQIAEALGGIKANAKGDKDGKKRYGHYYFREEGLVDRYEIILRTK